MGEIAIGPIGPTKCALQDLHDVSPNLGKTK